MKTHILLSSYCHYAYSTSSIRIKFRLEDDVNSIGLCFDSRRVVVSISHVF